MSERNSGQSREFEPIPDGEMSKFLWEGAKTLSTTMVWTKGQEHCIHTHLTRYDREGRCLYVWIPKGFKAQEFNDSVAMMNEPECFFSVSLTRANIFFSAPYCDFDDGGFRFGLPEKIFKVQRRNEMRFRIPDGHVMKVEFSDPLFPDKKLSQKVFDISAGGVAFVVTDLEAPVYVRGSILRELSFTVRGRPIVCDAEIRHLKTFKEGSRVEGVQVGIAFKNIKEADRQVLATYVFEETRKFYSRLV